MSPLPRPRGEDPVTQSIGSWVLIIQTRHGGSLLCDFPSWVWGAILPTLKGLGLGDLNLWYWFCQRARTLRERPWSVSSHSLVVLTALSSAFFSGQCGLDPRSPLSMACLADKSFGVLVKSELPRASDLKACQAWRVAHPITRIRCLGSQVRCVQLSGVSSGTAGQWTARLRRGPRVTSSSHVRTVSQQSPVT